MAPGTGRPSAARGTGETAQEERHPERFARDAGCLSEDGVDSGAEDEADAVERETAESKAALQGAQDRLRSVPESYAELLVHFDTVAHRAGPTIAGDATPAYSDDSRIRSKTRRSVEGQIVRILYDPSHRYRAHAAEEFLRSLESQELLLVGATREAADELAIRTSSRALFGIHRFSPGQLISRMAREAMAERGLAPASGLAVEAVSTRVAHQARIAGELDRLGAVSSFPGFARALGRTMSELRLAEITPETITASWSEGSEIASLLARFISALEQAGLADRARQIELAMANGPASSLHVLPLLLLDVPIGSRLESRFWSTLLCTAPKALVTVSRHDARTLQMLRAEGLVTASSVSDRAVARVSVPDQRVSDRTSPDEPTVASLAGRALTRLQSDLFSPTQSTLETRRDATEAIFEAPLDEGPDKHRFEEELDTRGGVGKTRQPDIRDDSVEVFSAPGEARECVEIARRILQSEVPFDRIAVLLRAPELYNHPLDTALRRARIPVYFARGTRRPDPAGRAFLALLDCAVGRLSARRFAEYLSFSQVPELDENGAPPKARTWVPPSDETMISGTAQLSLFANITQDRESAAAESEADSPAPAGSLRAPWKWEEYLVEAAVIRGFERWERRIRGYGRELTLQIEQLRREDPESARLPGLERDRANLVHLERFALPVIRTLDDWPREATWGEWRRVLTALAPRVLRRPDRVVSVLAEFEPMSEVGPVTLAEVRGVLWNRLALLETDPPSRRYGQVFVATPEQARGREFDLVFVPGLAERVFPRPPHEDPLLLDHARLQLSDALLSQDDRTRNERLQLALAVGAGSRQCVLSYPRIELSMARPRVPSFYCLEVARATAGEIPDLDLLERDAAQRSDARLAWPAPSKPEVAIDDVEHDLAVLGPLLDTTVEAGATDTGRSGYARYLFSLNPHLARSLRARYSRWQIRRWTPADGITRITEAIDPILAAHRLKARPYSVTALENFAVCPYRFLLASIQRLEPRADAAPLVRMDPLTRGSFIHEIQAIFFRRLSESSGLPVRTASLKNAEHLLGEVVTQVATRYADDVAPAIERVWQDEIDGIRADLKIWLRKMVDEPWTPAHFELAFGLGAEIQKERDPASIPDPVSLPGGWLLRGAVDLVERAGQRIRVTDHKTGRNRTEVGTITANGKVLQPVLYGLVIETMLGAPVEQSRLYFCTSRGGFSERIVHLDERARLFGSEAMHWIDDAIGAGQLPAFPEKDACGRCDFRTVCGPNEEIRTKQKPSRELVSLHDVRGLP